MGSSSTSAASSFARENGSAEVSSDAQNHHSGPDIGCRSMMRRQATTRPAGSIRRPAQGAGGLADDHPLISPGRTGDVAEAFDGVHRPARYRARGDVLPLRVGLLPSAPVASNPSPDITLTPLDGDPRPLEEWLTTFHLASVVLDPYTNESSWILPTAARILHAFRGSDARVNFVVTCSRAEARMFLGPLADEFLVFCDPDRAFVKGLGLHVPPGVRVPAHRRHRAGGGRGLGSRRVARRRRGDRHHHRVVAPDVPRPGDPGPFHGTPPLA